MSEYDYKFVVKENIGEKSEETFGKPNEVIYQMKEDGFYGKNLGKCVKRSIENLKKFWEGDGKFKTIFELYKEPKEEQPKENAIHPTHYQNCSVECIDVMLMTFGYQMTYDFCVLNAFKYIWRYKNKNGTEDLKKARYYVNCAYQISNLPEAKYMCIQEVRNVDMILKKIEKENDL